MLGRHTTLVGRIMAAVALLTILTGASEEYGGVIVHVELERTENPAPVGHDSWAGVTPSDATGPRYYWAPTGWVVVQRTDGSYVRAENEFTGATYMSRVSLLESRTGNWFVTAVEEPGKGYIPYQPEQEGPRPPADLFIAENPLVEEGGHADQGELMMTSEQEPLDPHETEELTSDGHIADPSETWGDNPGYEILRSP